ncbi:hypothetical protein Hanom_Chr12g01166431 [Helianthus anomalus]
MRFSSPINDSNTQSTFLKKPILISYNIIFSPLWHPRKIHSQPDLTPCYFYQILGRNCFQVGDDVTTRVFKVFPSARYLFTNSIIVNCLCMSCILDWLDNMNLI